MRHIAVLVYMQLLDLVLQNNVLHWYRTLFFFLLDTRVYRKMIFFLSFGFLTGWMQDRDGESNKCI